MDKEHVKGAADRAKGAVKDAVGKPTTGLASRRQGDKAKGAAHSAAGDAKDAMKK